MVGLMAGGFHTHDQLRRGLPLAERTQRQPAAEPDAPPVQPRPCWLTADSRLPGHVLAWQRDHDGSWTAVVVVCVPAQAVQPRDSDLPGAGSPAQP